MQGDKGGVVGTKKKTSVPRVPRATKQAVIHGAQMGFLPFEVNPPPVPRSTPSPISDVGMETRRPKTLINVPSQPTPGRKAVRRENNQFRAALAGPDLNVPIKINGKVEGSRDYLLRTMTREQRRAYNRAIAPPLHPQLSLADME